MYYSCYRSYIYMHEMSLPYLANFICTIHMCSAQVLYALAFKIPAYCCVSISYTILYRLMRNETNFLHLHIVLLFSIAVVTITNETIWAQISFSFRQFYKLPTY